MRFIAGLRLRPDPNCEDRGHPFIWKRWIARSIRELDFEALAGVGDEGCDAVMLGVEGGGDG